MRCTEVRSLVKSYHENQIEEYTRIKIHHHLASCESCMEDYGMWMKGEEWLQDDVASSHASQVSMTSSASKMNQQVMARIREDNRWANPSTEVTSTYSRKTKKAMSLAGLTMMLLLMVLIATMFIPQTEVAIDQPVEMEQIEEEWAMNTIILEETVSHPHEGTSMNFDMVASLNNPLVYALPHESSQHSMSLYIFISVFGIFCVVISMSWLTRV
ncbi:zf-HC2 domain-containing protein [Caldalkalibacillus salinus]|uniref:zf-HC2 domain-containing protein n=1 Tax=Caldalkalibacillus salinus TaxID=2803787 RepID=UPI0019235443|nr:zf-HC2 domain-containing protein [Caldalkalibacillus salinus]